jgi:hypothetical protein
MLSEMICTEKFLGLIALAKLVHMVQVLCSSVPVRGIGELFATEPTYVGRSWTTGRGVKCSLNASKCSA